MVVMGRETLPFSLAFLGAALSLLLPLIFSRKELIQPDSMALYDKDAIPKLERDSYFFHSSPTPSVVKSEETKDLTMHTGVGVEA